MPLLRSSGHPRSVHSFLAATAWLTLLGVLGCVAAEAPEDDEAHGVEPLAADVEHPSDLTIQLALESAGIVIGPGDACNADRGPQAPQPPTLVASIDALEAIERTPHRLLADAAHRPDAEREATGTAGPSAGVSR